MTKEIIDSTWGSVKDRFTNPFLGTFLFVWIVRNWYLVYGLFIFDKECTMDDKLNYVKDYFKDYDILIEFLKNTSISLLLLVIVYVLLVGSQAIIQSYHLIINKVNGHFDKIPIESKEHYLMLNREFKNLSVKYKELSATNDLNITEIETLGNTIIEQTKSINSLKLSCSYIFEQFLITYPYARINKFNKNDIVKHFNDVYHSVSKSLKNDDLTDVIINVLNDLNTNDNNVLVYFESQYLTYLSLQNSIDPEEVKRLKERYNDVDTKVAGFSEDLLFRMGTLSLILNLSGINPNEEVTDLGLNVYRKLFGY